MKWNTSAQVALGIGGLLVEAIGLWIMGIRRPVLMLLHFVSLTVFVLALVVLRSKTESPP